jgi:hypothetical protein
MPTAPTPYGQPPETGPQTSRSWRHDVVVAAVIIVALELVALPIGLIWGHAAPHPQYSVGGHQLNLVVGDAKPLVRGDGWFLLITGAAGLLSGLVVFFTAKRAEIGATLGLAIGGLMAGWLAWRIGHAWTGGLQPIQLALKPDNTKARLAADLGARVVLVGWAVAAVAVHGLLYAVTWPAKHTVEAVPAAAESWPAPAGPPVPET